MTKARQRRRGTIPHRTYWTEEAVAIIDRYQAQHQLPSFSVAAETLVRLGIEQSPLEVIAPIVQTVVRRTLRAEMDRIAKLQIYTLVEAGMARRFAAATLRELERTMTDAERSSVGGAQRYAHIKEAIAKDTRGELTRGAITAAIADLYGSFIPSELLDMTVETADGETASPTMAPAAESVP